MASRGSWWNNWGQHWSRGYNDRWQGHNDRWQGHNSSGVYTEPDPPTTTQPPQSGATVVAPPDPSHAPHPLQSGDAVAAPLDPPTSTEPLQSDHNDDMAQPSLSPAQTQLSPQCCAAQSEAPQWEATPNATKPTEAPMQAAAPAAIPAVETYGWCLHGPPKPKKLRDYPVPGPPPKAQPQASPQQLLSRRKPSYKYSKADGGPPLTGLPPTIWTTPVKAAVAASAGPEVQSLLLLENFQNMPGKETFLTRNHNCALKWLREQTEPWGVPFEPENYHLFKEVELTNAGEIKIQQVIHDATGEGFDFSVDPLDCFWWDWKLMIAQLDDASLAKAVDGPHGGGGGIVSCFFTWCPNSHDHQRQRQNKELGYKLPKWHFELTRLDGSTARLDPKWDGKTINVLEGVLGAEVQPPQNGLGQSDGRGTVQRYIAANMNDKYTYMRGRRRF